MHTAVRLFTPTSSLQSDMKIKAVLFDLDGTLLPMDQEKFVKDYFGRIARYLAPYGVDPNALVDAIWRGTGAMMKNDGSMTNEDRFWQTVSGLLGENIRDKEPFFERFYIEEFDKVRASCGFDAEAAPAVRTLAERGYRLILATSPIFPAIATEKRLEWTGLMTDEFEYITTYENSRFCKPSLDYYRGILEHCGLAPDECIMVGNDVGEDMVAERLGSYVYLVTRDLINRGGSDISAYHKGTLAQLPDYIDSL